VTAGPVFRTPWEGQPGQGQGKAVCEGPGCWPVADGELGLAALALRCCTGSLGSGWARACFGLAGGVFAVSAWLAGRRAALGPTPSSSEGRARKAGLGAPAEEGWTNKLEFGQKAGLFFPFLE